LNKNKILEKEIEARNFNRGGQVSSKLKTALTRLGIIPEVIRKTAIITYELEMNIIIHSNGGRIVVKIDKDEILITARDRGPGIRDVKKALKPGYSTAEEKVREMGFGAGMGLNNVREYSDFLEINTEVDSFTEVRTSIKLSSEE